MIDTGKIGDNAVCPPQLLAFDLSTDQLIYRHRPDPSTYVATSLFITPVSEFIYISKPYDLRAFGISIFLRWWWRWVTTSQHHKFRSPKKFKWNVEDGKVEWENVDEAVVVAQGIRMWMYRDDCGFDHHSEEKILFIDIFIPSLWHQVESPALSSATQQCRNASKYSESADRSVLTPITACIR